MIVMVDPVGISDIARKTGYSRVAIRKWAKGERVAKTPFPRARWTVSDRPAWNWPDVEKWLRRNRLIS